MAATSVRSTPVLIAAEPLRSRRRWLWTPAEWGIAAALLYFTVLFLLLWPAPRAEIWIGVDSAGLALLAGLSQTQMDLRAEIVRAWAVLLLWMPLAYAQSGAFGTTLVGSVEPALIHLDRLFCGLNWWQRRPPAPGMATTILEIFYTFNHVALAIALLLGTIWAVQGAGKKRPRYGRKARRSCAPPQAPVTRLAGALALGLLLCYVCFPFLPAVTPRLYFPQLRGIDAEGWARALNAWLLAHFGIPSGIFPSGHVAGPAALTGGLWRLRRRGWTLIYGLLTLVIAFATVHGNYHFVVDAVAGGAVGAVAGFGLEPALARRISIGN